MGLGPARGLLQHVALRPGSVFLEYLQRAACRLLCGVCGGTLHRVADVVLLCAVKLARLHGEGTITGNLRLARVRMLCPISGQSL